MSTLRVNEIFGPTIQGEGPSQGRAAWFLRLAGCNLTCVWCDTPYTWDWKGQNGIAYDRVAETHPTDVEELAKELGAAIDHEEILVITGGEPLLQQRALADLLDIVSRETEIETNGTMIPAALADSEVRFNVSPKLANAGCVGSWRPEILDSYPAGSILKFVVEEPDDFEEIEERLRSLKRWRPVWVMPQGKTRSEIEKRLPWVFDGAAARGWSVSARLHVLAHDDQRGV